jgi:hypothetical protein
MARTGILGAGWLGAGWLGAGRLVAGAAVVALAGTACSTATGQVATGTAPAGQVKVGTAPAGTAPAGTAPVGTVTGKFLRIGGPMGPGGTTPTVPLSGQVKFTGAHHHAFKVRVGKKGTFEIVLPAGSYKVIGRTPDITGQDGNGPVKDGTCALPHKVQVARHHTVRIKVICEVH